MSSEEDIRKRREIVRLLTEDQEKLRLVEDTEKGPFQRTNLGVLDELLKAPSLSRFKSALESGGNLLDVGSGTGEGLAYFSTYPVKVYGIEYSERYLSEAERTIEQLGSRRLVDRQKIKQVRGDFTDMDSYRRLGINFSDINLFYYYWGFQEEPARKLVRLIKEQCRSGTLLLLVTQPRRNALFERELKIVGVTHSKNWATRVFIVYEKE